MLWVVWIVSLCKPLFGNQSDKSFGRVIGEHPMMIFSIKTNQTCVEFNTLIFSLRFALLLTLIASWGCSHSSSCVALTACLYDWAWASGFRGLAATYTSLINIILNTCTSVSATQKGQNALHIQVTSTYDWTKAMVEVFTCVAQFLSVSHMDLYISTLTGFLFPCYHNSNPKFQAKVKHWESWLLYD